MPANGRRLRMLLLPSKPWRPNWDSFRLGQAPHPTRMYEYLAQDHGIDTVLADPTGWPWNPFAGKHQALQGLDPVRAVRLLVQERRADIVLACPESGALALLALRGLARFRPRIAIIDILLSENWSVRRRILDFVVPRADAIYPLGSVQVTAIHDRWRTMADVRCLPQHMDTEFYQPGPLVLDGPVLSVGDDVGRDFDTLLQAWNGVSAALLLKSRLVPPNRAPPGVTILSMRLSPVLYRELFTRARFVVVPLHPVTMASGIGTTLEAMAMGLPLIVSDSPGIRDYVVNDETALIVPCHDPTALRAAIIRLLQEPETCIRLGAAARRFAERYISYPAHAAQLAAALRDLVQA